MYIAKIKLVNFKSFKGEHVIEFSEGILKYKGPVGYQGGLNQEQYFIPNSKNFGKVIKSYPIK